MEEEYDVTQKHEMQFSNKEIHQHFIDYLKLYTHQVTNLITYLISIWAILEILYGDDIEKKQSLILPLLILAFLFTLIKCLKEYFNTVPEILNNESKKIKNLYVLQKNGWQYKIAFDKLKKISLLKTEEIEKIKKGIEYIQPLIVNESEYISFLRSHPIGILRLVKSAKLSCIESFPAAVSNAYTGSEEDLILLINDINHLKKIYDQTIDFESRAYQIIPPDKYEQIHNYIFDWTMSIISGLNDFVDNLEVFSKVTTRELKKGNISIPNSTITFDLPENVIKFNKQIESMGFEI